MNRNVYEKGNNAIKFLWIFLKPASHGKTAVKLFSLISYLVWMFSCDNFSENISTVSAKKTFEETEFARIKSFAPDAKEFCRLNGFNTKLFFLVDMHVHSGKKRFFIYDMNSDSVVNSSMVAHGACGHWFLQDADFSNQPGCGCSSIGKYKIGGKYNGRFGDAYKLYGLDSSNSNAFKRCIVLHSYSRVPDNETYPDPICNSLGCPMVSPNFLKQLEVKIDGSSRPVLLWIVK
jgi:L,D-transpeptidase catalytic domain